MAGNVIVEDRETEDPPLRPRAPLLAALAMVSLGIFVLLPGRAADQADREVPDPAPEPTVTIPSLEFDARDWVRLDLPGSAPLTDVVRSPSGAYFATGPGPQFWHSPDALTWELVEHSGDATDARLRVAAAGEGGVAVGAEGLGSGRSTPAIWVTSDGQSWRELEVGVPPPAGLTGVAEATGRYVAWGWTGSSNPISPAAGPLLMASDDGEEWHRLEIPEGARLRNVVRLGERWFAMGTETGRASVWVSRDLRRWERIPTDGMPFGWEVTDLHSDGLLLANLVEMGSGRSRQWRQHPGGAWEALGETLPGGPEDLVVRNQVAVGSGMVWEFARGEGWAPAQIDGEVLALDTRIAVGGRRGQPALWIHQPQSPPQVIVDSSPGGRWNEVSGLGPGTVTGVWPVADRWLIVVDGRAAWAVDETGVEELAGPGVPVPLASLHQVGDEWVALPTFRWTPDGTSWEQRAEPWEGASRAGAVEGVSVVDGRAMAVGLDRRALWNVASSGDGGRSWVPADEPRPTTPVWDVSPIPGGFAATAARQRGTTEVVISRDGRSWETMVGGRVLYGLGVPAAVTEAGSLLLLDTGEDLLAPRLDPTALVRSADRLVLVAAGRMWIHTGGWDEVPLTPDHGMPGTGFQPIPLPDRLLVVASHRGRIGLYEWSP